jgi:undecaprenyl-diphosphatase
MAAALVFAAPAAGWAQGEPLPASATAAGDSTAARGAAGGADSSLSAPLPDRADSGTSMPATGAHEGRTPRTTGNPPPDAALFRLINGRWANPAFDAAMPIITDIDKWKIVIILVWSALVMFGGSKGRWAALVLIPLVAASDQLSSAVIKPLVARMRPCEVLGSVHLWSGADGWITTSSEIIGGYKRSFSFPSSHAANITASMLFLGLVYRRWLPLLLAFAFAVSYSRVYVGVHWPLDSAAGMLVGAALAFAAWWGYKKITGPDDGASGKTCCSSCVCSGTRERPEPPETDRRTEE